MQQQSGPPVSIQSLVSAVVKAMVDHPEDVVVHEEQNGTGDIVLKIKVNDHDVGQVIGKRGVTFGALRDIVKTISVKEAKRSRSGQHVYLELRDPRGGWVAPKDRTEDSY